jgi:hypothetical protein
VACDTRVRSASHCTICFGLRSSLTRLALGNYRERLADALRRHAGLIPGSRRVRCGGRVARLMPILTTNLMFNPDLIDYSTRGGIRLRPA